MYMQGRLIKCFDCMQIYRSKAQAAVVGMWLMDPEIINEGDRADVPPVPFLLSLWESPIKQDFTMAESFQHSSKHV